jgi:hypothetical protein
MVAGLITQNIDPEENEVTIYRSGSINGNSKSKSIDTLLGNDTDTRYSLAQVYTWAENTTKYIPNVDELPTPDLGGGLLLQQKLVDSYAKYHTSTKKIIGGVLDDVKNRVTYNTVLTYRGDDYLPISMEYITALDRYRGQWIEVGKTDVTITVDIFYGPIRGGILSPGVQGNPTDTQLSEIIGDTNTVLAGAMIKSRSYVTSSNILSILDHTIPTDINTAYTRKSIDDSYILYVNGVRWRYVPTIGEVTKAGVFTLTEETINWTIWRAIDAEVRLEVYDRLVIELNAII